MSMGRESRVKSLMVSKRAWGSPSSVSDIELQDGVLACGSMLGGEKSRIAADEQVLQAIDELLSRCGVRSWEPRYELSADEMVLDGESWSLRVEYEDGAVLESSGNNAWPDGFDELWSGLLGMLGE